MSTQSTIYLDYASTTPVDPRVASKMMEFLTPEGEFGNPEKMSDIQQIFAEENVAQCGYCTAGIVCSVTALFRKTKTPSDEQIKDTLNRHLCRCGSHSRILDAVYRMREGSIR